MDEDELISAWKFTKDPEILRLPVKTLKYNRVPTLAPLGVIKDKKTQARIDISLDEVTKNLNILKKHRAQFADKLLKALSKMDNERSKVQAALIDNPLTSDERLYDGFAPKEDQKHMEAVHKLDPSDISELSGKFKDPRLNNILPLYKARNFPKSLSGEELNEWEKFCKQKLTDGAEASRLNGYFLRLGELAQGKLSKSQQYLLEELKLYGEAVYPAG